jgi:uncharacterized protein YdeI (YjbR/CyaY-like superfamily)
MSNRPAHAVSAVFFTEPAEFHTWLEENHDGVAKLWVGFHKKATRRPSLTWPEAVDEALCFGWIDGVRGASATRATSSASRLASCAARGAP